MLGNKLYEYIETEKLEILGNPLPSEEVKPVADFENPADMEFTYDLGLAPKIDLDLGKNFKFDLFKIEATDKDIESSLENISQRTGDGRLCRRGRGVGDARTEDAIAAGWTERQCEHYQMRALQNVPPG